MAYYCCLSVRGTSRFSRLPPKTAQRPSDNLSSSCSGHFVNLLLGCTSGLNLAADLGPVQALLIFMIG